MHVIAFHSHDLRLLPYQVAACRKFLPLEKFTAIIGPYGTNQMTSAGNVRLAGGAAVRLGIDAINAPESFAGLLPHQRLRELIAWAADQTSGDRLIMHGDLFPMQQMTFRALMGGKRLAGRVHSDGRPALTWFALACGASLPGFDAPPDDSFRKWGSERRGDLGIEHCEPGFIHLDKLTMATFPGGGFAERFAAKVAAVDDMLRDRGITVEQMVVSEPVQDARRHAPRLMPPKTRGLGDVVSGVLESTGIGPLAKSVIERVTRKPCGCAGRREALNRLGS